MHRKGLVIGILILLILVNIGSTFAGDTDVKTISSVGFDGNTLYVGGSGPNNYTKIQDAIDNASHGDTVFVYGGFYDEYYPEYLCSVFIDKKINLIGEDKYTTIIDGGNHYKVVRIFADDIVISGFTIQNSGNNVGGISASFSNRSKYFKIYGNIIKNNNMGFAQDGEEFCEIYDNIISDNRYGMYILGSEVSIYGNIIENNEIGIRIKGCYAITIHNNNFENNAIGLRLDDSKVTISENNFIDNELQADYDNLIRILHLFFPFQFRSNWMNNYWDDWKLPIPRPIQGRWSFTFVPMQETFGPFPTFQFDWRPVVTPYDIEVL